MSEVLMIFGKQFYSAAKDYGFRRVVRIISDVSSFFFPFAFWTDCYLWARQKAPFFPLWLYSTALVWGGIVILAFAVIGSFATGLAILRVGRTLRLNVENTTLDESERASVMKSFAHLGILGALGFFAFRSPKMLVLMLLTFLLNFFVAPLVVEASDWVVQMLSLTLGQTYGTLNLLQFSVFDITTIWVVLLVVSFYSYIPDRISEIRFHMENQIRFSKWFVIRFLLMPFSIPAAVGWAIPTFLNKVGFTTQNGSALFTCPLPFTASTSVTEMVRKSFKNVQDSECLVSEHKFDIKNESDFEALRTATVKHFGWFATTNNVSNIRPAEALRVIAKNKLAFFLGFVEKRCTFIGIMHFNTVKKAREVFLWFDSQYVLKEFQAIAAKESDRARS